MSESRPEKRKVEMIESYWTGGEYGNDYVWNDNHGELIRCRACAWNSGTREKPYCQKQSKPHEPDWFCADGKRRE